MITKIIINNFKKLENIEFPISQSLVIIGPNNAGKSSIFQALCLWEIGITSYIQAHGSRTLNKNGAVTINRLALLNSPVPDLRSLWRNKKVAKGTDHIKIEVTLEGEEGVHVWRCRAQFEFYNNESFSCKITDGLRDLKKMYEENKGIHFAFLKPMSGIATSEDKLTQGSIDKRLGEGRTAEVIRNLCYNILHPENLASHVGNPETNWKKLVDVIKTTFGIELQKPELIRATGLLLLEYVENRIKYDISSAGSGLQQNILLFAYLFSKQNSVLLLDEPDAHLEVIRQRDLFQRVNETAKSLNSQLIIASHSEVVLNEAAGSVSKVIALIGDKVTEMVKDNNRSNVNHIRKALTEIGWEKYYLAKEKGHILYVEDPSDLKMLIQFASRLNHPVGALLTTANIQYSSLNKPGAALGNFDAIREFFPEIKGLALFDNIPDLIEYPRLKVICWKKRELENYFSKPSVLLRYARALAPKYSMYTVDSLSEKMKTSIKNNTTPSRLNNPKDEWWSESKISDDWLDLIFPEFYREIGLHNYYKSDYSELIALLPVGEIDEEVIQKLDVLYKFLSE